MKFLSGFSLSGFREEDKGDEEGQEVKANEDKEGGSLPDVFRYQSADERAEAKTAEKGGISITHPFPLFALRGEVAEVGYGDRSGHCPGDALREAYEAQVDNVTGVYIANRDEGVGEQTYGEKYLSAFSVR